MSNEKTAQPVTPAPSNKRVFYKVTVRADSFEDALKTIQEAYPEAGIAKDNIVYQEMIHPLTQGKLF